MGVRRHKSDVFARPATSSAVRRARIIRASRGLLTSKGVRATRGVGETGGVRETRGVGETGGVRETRGVGETGGVRESRGVGETGGVRETRGASATRGVGETRSVSAVRGVRAATALAAALVMVTTTVAPAAAQSSGWPINAEVAATPDPTTGGSGEIEVEGSGWGHSVGMSQYGARSQALSGRNASAILSHYYPGTALGSRNTDDPIRIGLEWGISDAQVRLVDGSGSWFSCSGGSCSRLNDVTQSPGQTVTVRQRGSSQLEIRRGGETQETVDVSGGAFVAFDHDGSVVEGPNPIHDRATYRHGRMEFAIADGSLAVTQRVPNVELYLRGLAEMPSSWPAAALQSQAIVGRTFALAGLGGMRDDCRCHLRASPADQAYAGWLHESEAGDSWVSAVQDSAGQVVTYQGELASTYYSSSHGGASEAIEDSWAFGATSIPYLPSVDDPWSIDEAADNPRASWSATLTVEQLRPLISSRLHTISDIEVLDRTAGGTPRTLRLTGADADGAGVQIDWPDGGNPAGARMRARFGSDLPSQQLTSISVGNGATPNPFTDIGGSGHVPAILFASEAGITQGVTATTYEPRRPVSREQVASLIARTFDLPDGDVSDFDDVAAGSRHADAIGSLTAADITLGCDTDNFCPRDPVSREQMASFLSRAIGLSTSGSAPFADVGANATHSGAIGALADTGITDGCDDTDNFCPRQPVSRAQMATFLHRTVRAD